jgi:hypothetical protein
MLRAAAGDASLRARLGRGFLAGAATYIDERSLAAVVLFVTVVYRAVPPVNAPPRRVPTRVRFRARGRAGPTPLCQCAPPRTHTPIWGQGRAFGPCTHAPFHTAASRVVAPPWPRRGHVCHARGRQEKGTPCPRSP